MNGAKSIESWGRKRIARARRRSRRQEGMTLIEIMIVVIIMAMIAAAVGMAVLPAYRRSQARQARTDAMTVRSAAEMYLAEESTADCPTISDLVEARILNSSARTTDPWGNEFSIRCDGDDITVTSEGLSGLEEEE